MSFVSDIIRRIPRAICGSNMYQKVDCFRTGLMTRTMSDQYFQQTTSYTWTLYYDKPVTLWTSLTPWWCEVSAFRYGLRKGLSKYR